ncbi:MAG: hypothetical protein L3K52_01295 [Candidatus Thiothrix sulfatifontis]|nr:MAG: hypothetical protein L3K52_01295 [Candidatus Thiothrix sulfatifontis]
MKNVMISAFAALVMVMSASVFAVGNGGNGGGFGGSDDITVDIEDFAVEQEGNDNMQSIDIASISGSSVSIKDASVTQEGHDNTQSVNIASDCNCRKDD